MDKSCQNWLGLGVSIAVGLVLSAGIVSYTANRISSNKQSVVVKGLAETPVTADQARWEVNVQGTGKSIAEAFSALRANRPAVLEFMKAQGFTDDQIQAGREVHQVVYRVNQDGMTTRDIDYYLAGQTLLISSTDVKRVDKAVGEVVKLLENNVPLDVANPEYLVSTLEKVKMSLIANATRNAYERASEFAKTGEAKVGTMKSANQGAFYILPARGGNNSDNEYGGTYDKSTIDKVARVVVTVEYALSQ